MTSNTNVSVASQPTSLVPTFPFTAIVGHERLQLALILTAISPGIGGVIVRGEKGTAKTTTVRALEPLLSGALVNLPLGATEDRVVGSIDIETVLTTGKATYQPGLLSAADGGILYVDEVNLLPDHLVDVLLDAASTGRITVERDSVSVEEHTRFVLVGTMNPEEGELRPQLLDRFGLSVDVAASRDAVVRVDIVKRRLAYDKDPQAFADQYRVAEDALQCRITRAIDVLPDVVVTDAALGRISSLCSAFDVDGMRADLVIARAATAHAAWRVAAIAVSDACESAGGPNAENLLDAAYVTDEDIRVAAEMALPHRRRRDPFDEPGLDEDQLDDAMDQAREDFPDQELDHDEQDHQPSTPDGDSGDVEPDSFAEDDDLDQAPAQREGKAGSAASGAPFPRS